jgi:DNA polymerase-1
LNEYAIQLQNEIAAIEKEIHTMAGIDFNIASPKQTGEVLFDRLNIVDKAKLTKTKQYATGEEVLVKLKNKHPIVEKILDYRGLAKLKSTYVDTLPLMVNERTGRVHASFNQAVAATGRLSSNNPNMQNIPVRTERGREIRKAFVPANHNFLLLSADYSQIELRIIAHMSKDEDMIAAFKQGVDIHTATAAKVYNVELAEVTKEMRRNAKTVNFGIIYGISAFGLSERLNIPRKEAAQIIEQYFLKYPTIKQYMDQSIAFAREHGYVETIMGRRRYIKDINSYNSNSRGYAERNAINAPIQGSAADMIKIAMIKIYQSLCEKNLKSRMILQVHDELVFDAHKDELEILKPIILHDMQHAIEMSVPIEVEMSTGENWLEAH